MNSEPDQEASVDLDAVLRMGVREVLSGRDFKSAFETFLAEMPRQSPEFAALIPSGAERAIAQAMFREIWNHTPRPEQGWKRLTLPKPERNSPCPCGSGAKYKQCCGVLQAGPPFPSGGFSVLCYVLETVPVAEFGSLPFKQLDPEEVAHVASEWQKDDRIEPATWLLEALLAPGHKLDKGHEYAFDTLCDLYLDAGRADDRLALVERIMQVSDKRLRAAAWQRRATLHADCGEHDQAWAVFSEALRLDPDNPSLAHLELFLLANQDRYDEAQRRAAFWAKRLVKLGYGGEDIVDFMEDVARDPDVLREMIDEFAEGEAEGATAEDVAELQALIDDLPAPSCQYRLTPEGDSAGPLQPATELAELEQEWEEVYWGDEEDFGPWDDMGWLDWLRDHPAAWQSFEVIDAVGEAVEEALLFELAEDEDGGMGRALLDHALGVLRLVLSENRAEGLKLEWGWMENRAALRLLMQRIENASDLAEELPLLEWLVLTLNPNDNTGHRERLVHAYCEAGRAADGLAVCDRYPQDDLAGILYGRVLALYLLDRRGDAVAALAHAVKRLPKVLKTLLAERPKAPPLTPGMVEHGGNDEAWQYRVESRETWMGCNALAWLKETSGRKT